MVFIKANNRPQEWAESGTRHRRLNRHGAFAPCPEAQRATRQGGPSLFGTAHRLVAHRCFGGCRWTSSQPQARQLRSFAVCCLQGHRPRSIYLATPNYSYEKRQRELAKKRKTEEKRQRKTQREGSVGSTAGAGSEVPEGGSQESPGQAPAGAGES